MDAEIRFFMTDTDEAEFLEFASSHIDEIKKTETPKQLFLIDDCELLYTPTVIEDKTMFSGVLEIRISADDESKGKLRTSNTYKKLRNWLKKKYWSRLAFINKTKKDKLTPSRIHWLGPDAKKWKEQDPQNHVLKLSKTSWMVFEIGF